MIDKLIDNAYKKNDKEYIKSLELVKNWIQNIKITILIETITYLIYITKETNKHEYKNEIIKLLNTCNTISLNTYLILIKNKIITEIIN